MHRADYSPRRVLKRDVLYTMNLEINNKILISKVQNKAPLYNTTIKEYHDRILKKILWYEVCQEVYSSSDWDLLSSQDKSKFGKEVQKRWTSLRHCFRRELSTQKSTPSGGAAPKRKKYMYFDSLSFLLPYTAALNSEDSIEDDDNEVDIVESQTKVTQEPQAAPRKLKPRLLQKNNEEKIIISLLKEGIQVLSDKQDEDELFLRSLIPHMREFSGDQKLLLRMEIMKTILNFKQSLKYCSEIKQERDRRY